LFYNIKVKIMLYVMCKWLKLAFNKINASQFVTPKSPKK